MGKRRSVLSGLSHFAVEAFQNAAHAPLLDGPAKEVKTGATKQPASERAEDAADSDPRPKKKRKTGLLGPGLERFDATSLVPFYTQPAQVPAHLQKYFSQRARYFSLYSSGCLLDEEGWYSVTPERVANQIAERCRCNVIVDAFCGVGGNAIAFAKTCERVIALDTSPVRLALARHNAALYGVEDRIEFILADFISFARQLADLQESSSPEADPQRLGTGITAETEQPPRKSRKLDVIFLSPPWGGPSYLTDRNDVEDRVHDNEENPLSAPEYGLASIRPVHGKELFEIARRLTQNVAYYLPRNVNLDEVAALLDTKGGADRNATATPTSEKNTTVAGEGYQPEMVEVEEEWMGSKLKALTCYFGGLVRGQEDLFDS